jgi:hypothetical protein
MLAGNYMFRPFIVAIIRLTCESRVKIGTNAQTSYTMNAEISNILNKYMI